MTGIPLVSIIIVTYEALDYIKVCLDSIRENTPNIPYEIIIIDNDSGDEVVNYLTSLPDFYDNMKVRFNDKNVLLTPAQNQGIKMVQN